MKKIKEINTGLDHCRVVKSRGSDDSIRVTVKPPPEETDRGTTIEALRSLYAIGLRVLEREKHASTYGSTETPENSSSGDIKSQSGNTG